MYKKSNLLIYVTILLLSVLVHITFLLINNFSLDYFLFGILSIPSGLSIGFIACYLVIGFHFLFNKGSQIKFGCWFFMIAGMFGHISLFSTGFYEHFTDASQYDKFPMGYYTGLGVSFAAYHLKLKYELIKHKK